jgi:hypothetical protein
MQQFCHCIAANSAYPLRDNWGIRPPPDGRIEKRLKMATRTADTLIAAGALSTALILMARKLAGSAVIVAEAFVEAKESARIAQERHRFIGE